MKLNKHKLLAALTVFALAFILSSCGGETPPEETVSPSPSPTEEIKEPYSEHLELYFMPRRALSEKAALSSDDATIQFLEEKYNLTFSIIETASEASQLDYGEILTTLISSGKFPDFMNMDVLGINAGEYEKLVTSGIALDVGSFMQENVSSYPLLQKRIFGNGNMDMFQSENGTLYCLPNYAAPDSTVYLVRGDWVEKSGYTLSDINTLEKFSELMNIFVEKDFDDKGADGFSTSAEKYLFPIYTGYTGAYKFKNVDGYYTDWYTLYELRESLGYIYLMYKTRAFDNDYLSHDGAVPKEKIITGRAGCVATEIKNLPLLEAELKENIPEGHLEPLPVSLSGPGGSTRYTDKEYSSANVISVYFEDPARIFDMCEFLFTDAGLDLISNGVEGVHYNIDGDDIVPNFQAYDDEGWKYKADGTIEAVQTYNEIRNIITNIDVIKAPEYPVSAAAWYSELLNYTDIHSNPFGDNGFDNGKVFAALTSVKDKWVDDFVSGEKLLTDKNWEAFVEEYLQAGAQDQMDFYNGRTN